MVQGLVGSPGMTQQASVLYSASPLKAQRSSLHHFVPLQQSSQSSQRAKRVGAVVLRYLTILGPSLMRVVSCTPLRNE